MTAEPSREPGSAPPDHQPTLRGFGGGVSAPSSVAIASTAAETCKRGTVRNKGFPGRADGVRVGTVGAGRVCVAPGNVRRRTGASEMTVAGGAASYRIGSGP